MKLTIVDYYPLEAPERVTFDDLTHFAKLSCENDSRTINGPDGMYSEGLILVVFQSDGCPTDEQLYTAVSRYIDEVDQH